MEYYFKYLIMFFLTSSVIVNGFHIKREATDIEKNKKSDHSKVLSSWDVLRKKLLSNSKNLDKILHDDVNDSIENSFNELEVLKMIPSVIDKYRSKELSKNDLMILSEIYSENLWSMICEEADRTDAEETNPLLHALFKSFNLINNQNTNNIDENIIRKLQHKKPPSNKKLLLNINRDDHPSQRVLNTAAMLIHQEMNLTDLKKSNKSLLPQSIHKNNQEKNHFNKRKSFRRISRRGTLNLQLTNIPIQEISRSKRNIQFRVTNADLSASRIDALLKIFNENHGLDSNEYEDEDGDNIEIEEKNHVKDYFYNDSYEDDEEAFISNVNQDYGSFQDLILLATKHRLQREKEENKMIHPKYGRHFIKD